MLSAPTMTAAEWSEGIRSHPSQVYYLYSFFWITLFAQVVWHAAPHLDHSIIFVAVIQFSRVITCSLHTTSSQSPALLFILKEFLFQSVITQFIECEYLQRARSVSPWSSTMHSQPSILFYKTFWNLDFIFTSASWISQDGKSSLVALIFFQSCILVNS